MTSGDVFCQRCGNLIMSGKTQTEVLRVINENRLDELRDQLMICPQCRREMFSLSLIGSDLKKVSKVPYVPKRRSEDIRPLKMDSRTGAEVFKSECFICNSGCDATVWVKDGEVVKVEGDPSSPVTKGVLCAKGLASKQILYHPKRIKHPMERIGERGEGKWRSISWDEALDLITNRFKEIENIYGQDSIVLAQGTSRGWTACFSRFTNAWGKQRTGPGVAQCALPRISASLLVTGSPVMECPDYEYTNCMLVWGTNPPATWPVKAMSMMQARARGARLIVIDPILSETASKADIWLKLRPGTDAALGLGMLNVIISEGLFDKGFVDKWCLGFEELTRRAKEYPLERAEEITWVPKEVIAKAARLYATTKPASITQALALDQNGDTISTGLCTAMLAAITGNIDTPGGNIIPPHLPVLGGLIDSDHVLKERCLSKERHEKRLGGKEYPLLAGEACVTFPTAHNFTLWKAILTGEPYPVRAMYCHGNNMAIAYPNSRMVTEALRSLDFFVVADLFMTPTVEIADIVLPAASWMERSIATENIQVSYNNVHLQQKVVELDGCWTDYKILIELAKRLGFGEFMFRNEEEYRDHILKPSGMTWQEFKEKGIISVPLTFYKYEPNGFNTQSGKVELSIQKLMDLASDPLPTYREPSESPVSTPEVAKEYPLILTTGAREPVFRHSELRNVPLLREIWPNPMVKLNPQTAGDLGINEGDLVMVETPRGSMTAKAWIRPDIDPRVVQVPTHWWGDSNANLITDNEKCAPLTGSAQLRCQLCRISRGRF